MIIPGQRWLPIKKLNVWLSVWWLKWQLSHTWFKPSPHQGRYLWFFEPFFMPAFLTLFNEFASVYDCVDRYSPLGEEAQRAEAIVKSKVNRMTVISDPLLTQHSQDRPDVVKVPLGFDEPTFAKFVAKQRSQPTQLKHKQTLKIGYSGGINYRFDFQLLFKLIANHPHHTFWFVGPLQLTLIPGDTQTAANVKKLLAFPNVSWTPPQPKHKMPALITKMDVCLIPYDLKHEFNRYCHPMKVAEYLYLGKPVITTPIVEFKQPHYQQTLLFGSTARDFARHLTTLQKQGWTATQRRRQRQVAVAQTWEAKVAAVSQVLTTAEPT
jgi:glycosyltransferase involved in cell wall biosynthesis